MLDFMEGGRSCQGWGQLELTPPISEFVSIRQEAFFRLEKFGENALAIIQGPSDIQIH